MSSMYTLDGHTPVACDDVMAWRHWMETADRRVANQRRGGVRVSTVFLGLNHNWGGGRPLLFETMVFGGPHDENQNRYATWEEAEAGHAAMCARVFPGR